MLETFPTAAILAAALLLPLPTAQGQDAAPKRLTLPEVLSLAEAADPGLGAARRRFEAAEQEGRASGSLRLPQLSIDADWDRTELPARVFAQKLNRGQLAPEDMELANLNGPSADWNLETSLGLSLPIDLFGGLAATAAQARAGAKAEQARAQAALGDLRLAATRVFLGILVADRAAAAAEKTYQAARGLEEEVSARLEAGGALSSDLLRVRFRRRSRELALERARSDAELLRARLRALVGWPPGRPVDLEEPPSPPEEDRDLDGWIRRAEASSPELRAAEADAAGVGASLRREKSTGRPSLRLLVGYQDDRSALRRGQGSPSAELQLHWSILDFGRPYRLAAERERLAAASEDRRRAASDLRLSVEASWRQARLARLEAEAARAGREEAAEVFRVTRERWEAGRALLTDVLESESASAAAAADEARAGAAVLAADAELKRAAGEL